MDWTLIVVALISGGVITKLFDYIATGREDKMTKIQGVYDRTLELQEKEILQRDKKILELEKEVEIKDARLDEARQRQGEMLIDIEEMKHKLNKVDDNVNKITGDFGKYPLVNDRSEYGRRASDKPKGEN